MSVQDIVKEVTNELERIVNTKTVVGTPIQAADKTIIPIAEISVGFASGGFDGSGEKTDQNENAKAFGGGGGGGAKIIPVAFIVLYEDKSEILTLKNAGLEKDLLKVVDSLPDLIDRLRSKKKSKEDAENDEYEEYEDEEDEFE